MLHRGLDWLLASVSGPCLLCHGTVAGYHGLCRWCLAHLPTAKRSCQRCAVPVESGDTCGPCALAAPVFGRAEAAFVYEEPLTSLILQFKYAGASRLGRTLAYAMARRTPAGLVDEHATRGSLSRLGFPASDAVLVPVPSTKRRWCERGYNPAEEISRFLARYHGCACLPGLVVWRDSGPPQSSLPSAAARQRNVLGRLRLTARPPSEVVVVDDVMTTGSTVAEVARTLLRGGTARVQVWVLARAVLKRSQP